MNGDNMKKRALLLIYFSIVIGCGTTKIDLGINEEEEIIKPGDETPSGEDTGSITISVTDQKAFLFKAARIQDITSFHVLVTKDGANYYDGSELEIKNIPIGMYGISLEAKDKDGKVIYTGAVAGVEVKKNETTSVTITLNEINNTNECEPLRTITISASPEIIYSGDSLNLTANHGKVSGTPTYIWYQNEAVIDGQNAKSITLPTTGLSGEQRFFVYVKLSNTISCGPGSLTLSIISPTIVISDVIPPSNEVELSSEEKAYVKPIEEIEWFYGGDEYNFNIEDQFNPSLDAWTDLSHDLQIGSIQTSVVRGEPVIIPEITKLYLKENDVVLNFTSRGKYKGNQFTSNVFPLAMSDKFVLHSFLAGNSTSIPVPTSAWAGAFYEFNGDYIYANDIADGSKHDLIAYTPPITVSNNAFISTVNNNYSYLSKDESETNGELDFPATFSIAMVTKLPSNCNTNYCLYMLVAKETEIEGKPNFELYYFKYPSANRYELYFRINYTEGDPYQLYIDAKEIKNDTIGFICSYLNKLNTLSKRSIHCKAMSLANPNKVSEKTITDDQVNIYPASFTGNGPFNFIIYSDSKLYTGLLFKGKKLSKDEESTLFEVFKETYK